MSVLIGITPAYFSVFTCLFICSLKAVLKGCLKACLIAALTKDISLTWMNVYERTR